jgi:hypothetical protein
MKIYYLEAPSIITKSFLDMMILNSLRPPFLGSDCCSEIPAVHLSPVHCNMSPRGANVCSHEKEQHLRRHANYSTLENTTDRLVGFNVDLFTVVGGFRHNKLLNLALVMRDL